ncbi:hypothetical protein [Rudaeicoccus suwonensis]|uniref:hypothetical protein n=1 Tax=Rudaeicoccus suwonensis TaxID=657409 RepID=UPI00119E40F5|nr:hypothetical protein [Rudaeicoccus suwonensis]
MSQNSIVARVRSAGERVRHTLPAHAWRRSQQFDIGTLTLALSAQQVLCTGPLFVAISAVMRRYRSGSVIQTLNDVLGLSGESAREVAELFRTTGRPSMWDLVVGVILCFVFMTGVAATTQRILETVWRQSRASLVQWWRQLLWATVFLPVLGGGMWLSHAARYWHMSNFWVVTLLSLGTGVGATLFYWWTQHVLLLGQISWRRLLPGSVMIGVMLLIETALAQYIVPGQVIEGVADYGLIGATFVLSVWVMVLSTIVVLGMFLGAVWDEYRSFRASNHGASAPLID